MSIPGQHLKRYRGFPYTFIRTFDHITAPSRMSTPGYIINEAKEIIIRKKQEQKKVYQPLTKRTLLAYK